MAADWKRLCTDAGLRHRGDEIEVDLGDGRGHVVRVADEADAFLLVAVAARRGELASVNDAALLAWRRNRGTQLVGFRIDQRGRLVGEAWMPKAGLTAAELGIYVRAVAAECDRLEFLITGVDRDRSRREGSKG